MSLQILVPLDGSRFSEQAIPQAVRLAQRSRGSVHLVRVLTVAPLISSEMIAVLDDRAVADERRGAQAYLDQQTSGAAASVNAYSVLLNGPVVRSLSDYIARAGIELVVMTTHGRTGLGRTLLGSVADALVRAVHVPVLLLRPHKGDTGPVVDNLATRRIIVPLDGSPLAEQALEQAAEIEWLSGAHYTLLQVVSPPFPETYAAAVETQISSAEEEHTIERAHEYLEPVADRLRAAGLSVDTVVSTQASSAAAIVQEAVASDADMIVMVTHGRSGWKRFTLGSVTQQVLHNATRPLLLMRSSKSALAGTMV